MKIGLDIDLKENTVSGTIDHADTGMDVSLGTKKASDLMKSLTGSQPDVGLMPPAIRWISADRRTVVFERPPTVQYIEYIPEMRDNIMPDTPVYSFNLPVPWTVYFTFFDEHYNPVVVNVYCRNEAITSLDDALWTLPMLNLYHNNEVCNPIFDKFEMHDGTLAAGMQTAYNMVWNSGWNLDLRDLLNTAGINPGVPVSGKFAGGSGTVNYLRKWEALSIMQVLDVQWQKPLGTKQGHKLEDSPGGPYDNSVTSLLKCFQYHIRANQVGLTCREAQIKLVNSMSAI